MLIWYLDFTITITYKILFKHLQWPSGLRCCDKCGRFPVQTPLGARPGLGTEPRYEVPGDLRVEIVKTQ